MASDMTQWVKESATKSDDPWLHMVERENQLLQVVFWPSHSSHGSYACAFEYTKKEKKNESLRL